MTRLHFALFTSLLLAACGDDGSSSDAAADSTTSDGEVMCIALGAECDGTVPCCAPNACAGGMCGAPRSDGGGDAAPTDAATGDAATCADFGESCATLPCCEPTAQCVMPSMTCQPGEG